MPQTPIGDETLERRLRDLLDRDAILQTVHRLARALDRMDDQLALSCYWPDAIDDHNHFVGTPEGFVAYCRQVTLSFDSCQHGLLTHTCEIDGDDALAETYYIFTGEKGEGPHFMSTGRYVDHFQRREGEWRIANRLTIVEGTYDMPASLVNAGAPPAWPVGERPSRRDRTDASYSLPLPVRRPA